MTVIGTESKRSVEEHFFTLPIGDAVLRPILADVSIVPIEAFALREELEPDHVMLYIAFIYVASTPAARRTAETRLKRR
jgi:hypothetical protein